MDGVTGDTGTTISITFHQLSDVYPHRWRMKMGDADHVETAAPLVTRNKGDTNVAAWGRTMPTTAPTTRPRRGPRTM